MAYVRCYSPRLEDIVDEFSFLKYLKGDATGEKIFGRVDEYLHRHNVSPINTTAVATDGARATFGR